MRGQNCRGAWNSQKYLRKANLARLLARRPDGIFVSEFEQGEIGPDLFRKACEFGLEGLVCLQPFLNNPSQIRAQNLGFGHPSPQLFSWGS
jgi:hypothetical protein